MLLYGITRRINLAFGGIAMWGAYLMVGAMTWLLALTDLGVVPALLLGLAWAVAGTAVLGFAVQHVVIQPLRRAPSLAMMIATLGLAIGLEEAVRLAQGSRERWLQPLLADPIPLGGTADFPLQVTAMQVSIAAATALIAAALLWLMARHPFGRDWRACAQDQVMAALCGIRVARTIAVAFVLASMLAAVSGAIIAVYYGGVSHYMGLVIGLKALLAAVLGGLGSVRGALAGGLLLGILETFWAAYFPADYRDVAVFGMLVAVLIFRPQGLLGGPGHTNP